MSTNYILTEPISEKDLVSFVEEHPDLEIAERKDDSFAITDGKNYLWFDPPSEEGGLMEATRYGANDPDFILDEICIEFNSDALDEYEDEYFEFLDAIDGVPEEEE